MPYDNVNDLPDNVKSHLPLKAQEIFMEAFNNAFKQYNDDVTAFKVAWSAVKKKYEKKNNKWVKK